MRDLCEKCKQNPKAINYKKRDRIYYRRFCNACLIMKKKEIIPWQQEGYKKKFKCESCDFVPKTQEQLTVCNVAEVWRTVCLNCEALFKHSGKINIKKELRSDF